MANIINHKQAAELINAVKDGEFFGISFTRKAPKCTGCGRRNAKWTDRTTCPHCGSELSFTRDSVCQKGVANPGNPNVTKPGEGLYRGKGVANPGNPNVTKPGEGLYRGESAAEAWKRGNVKFYDVNAKEGDGRGGYRTAGLAEIYRVRIGGVEFEVK